jgi:putative hemolysin
LRRQDPGRAYSVRLASSVNDVRAAQTLRFLVFNLELNEGLERSFATFRDEDRFDSVCDHLVVEDRRTEEIVGTYRLQTGRTALARLGYYSSAEFNLDPFEPWRSEILELGRACVHSQHRNLIVLGLLWRGIARYAGLHGARYLIGCSSLPSVDPAVGAAHYAAMMERNLVAPEWRTLPQPEYACPLSPVAEVVPKLPKLLSAYLSLGARICSPPAVDREFRTIDFLTWMDLASASNPLLATGR